jgi:methionyl-tRNA formyltransferase
VSVLRIAFLGTPEFARDHLEGLLNDPHFEVVGVVTQPDRPSGRHMNLTPSPVKKLALERNCRVISPESIKAPEVLDEISKWRAEAAVVVAYGQIVSQSFLDLFPMKVVNVHASLLPRWRGAAPIQRAIQSGDTKTGVALQVMTKKLDAGDVIGFCELLIPHDMDSFQLHQALIPIGKKLLNIDFMDYLRGQLSPKPQNELEVTYAHKIEKSEAQIIWGKTAIEVHNHVRAFVMGPGSFCNFSGKKLKLVRTEVSDPAFDSSNTKDEAVSSSEKIIKNKNQAGKIIKVEADSFFVLCGYGVLRVHEVQPESRSKMKVKDFLLGHTLKVGDILA